LDDLVYLLEHGDVTEEMSERAKELVRARHTRRARALGLYEFLCGQVGKS